MSKAASSIHHPEYHEAAALQELLEAAVDVLVEAGDKLDQDERYLDAEFTIIIGGQSKAFVLGGPQYQALVNFVKSIAEENSYTVDTCNNTVTE